jgi:hypothetical protein
MHRAGRPTRAGARPLGEAFSEAGHFSPARRSELLARHERTHVSFLRRWLASNAGDERTYDFGDATKDPAAFARTAQTLEETAVGGYLGQGANLTRSLMVPFAQMCSVEARHAAWINEFLESPPAPRAADEAKAPPEVLAVIEETGFETS